jgi:amino acid transporter
MAVLLSIVFSYAAKFVQKSGAAYAYSKEAFGNLGGSIVGIMKIFTTILVNATMISIVISQLGKYIISLGGPNITYEGKYFWVGWIIIVAVLSLFTLIITSGGKTSGLFTNIITLAKIMPIIIFILIGMFYITQHSGNFGDHNPGKIKEGKFVGRGSLTGIVNGILILFYAYLGFDSLANSAEIYKNPKRNIPIALAVTMAILVVVYTVLMIVSIGALPKEILQDPTKSVIAEAARHTFMKDFGFHFIMIGSLISMFGITFMALFYTPFILARTAKDGLLPNILKLRNKNGSYYIALYFALILTVLLSFSGSWHFLLQLNVLSRFVQFIPTCIAIMIFKKRFKKKQKTSILLEISAILSILILVGLIIIQFVPLDGVNAGYYKTLIKMG